MMVTASGKAYLIEGLPAPTTRRIFDLQAQIGPGYPAYELYHCAFDPHDPNVAYITTNNYGASSVFRTLDLLAATPTWTDISGNGPRDPRKVFVHPVTAEVITSYHHGSMIYPRPRAGAPPSASPPRSTTGSGPFPASGSNRPPDRNPAPACRPEPRRRAPGLTGARFCHGSGAAGASLRLIARPRPCMTRSWGMAAKQQDLANGSGRVTSDAGIGVR